MKNEETISNPKNLYEFSTNGPVLYVRHAETDYNLACLTIPKELIRDKPQYIDCCLSDKGRNQAKELSERLKDLKIKYVFSSPLYRCLETALISLENHPERDNFSILINPLITEIVSGVHDFSKNIKLKQEKFNQNSPVRFDWSYFNSLYETEEERETYFLNYADNFSEEDKEVENTLKKIKDNKKLFEFNYPEMVVRMNKNTNIDTTTPNYSDFELFLSQFSRYFIDRKKRPETLKSMFNRNLKFKNYLKGFIKKLSKDEKILVLTHSSFGKISTSRMAYEMDVFPDFPYDCYKLSNCEIITMNLEME